MKVIISFFLLFSFFVSADVDIYSRPRSLLGVENTDGDGFFTSTLYGGSSDVGASSAADCTVKFKLKKIGKGFSGSLLPFNTELMAYTESEKWEASFEFDKLGIVFVPQDDTDVCPLSTDFSGDYVLVSKGSDEYKKNFNELLQLNYYNAVKEFRSDKRDVAIRLLEPYMAESIRLNYYQPDVYNDYGYFLQQAGMNQKAIDYLTIVKKKSPERVVLYLNIADAYWGIQKKTEAVNNYRIYINMMKKLGKSKSIPRRALERSH